MDVGDPSNFARVLDLYQHSHESICRNISAARYNDQEIAATLKEVYQNEGYLLDPHGACGYRALSEQLQEGECGIFLETAHPAKFKQTVENIISDQVAVPSKLQAFMQGEKQSLPMSKDFESFKSFLMKQ
jgi:threonine synthase